MRRGHRGAGSRQGGRLAGRHAEAGSSVLAFPCCDLVREALSAQLDGEDPLLPSRRVASHVARCEECRRFAARLPVLDPMVATMADAVSTHLDAARATRSKSRSAWRVCRLVRMAAAIPLLAVGPSIALVSYGHVRATPAFDHLRCSAHLDREALRVRRL